MKLLQRLLVVAAMITVLEVIQKVSTLNRLLEIQDQRAAAEAGLLTPMMTRKPRVHNNTESSHHDINEAIPSTVTTVGNTRIPDETFLTTRRRRQQQQQTEVQSAACQIPPLQGPEGSLGFQALTKIQLADNEEIRSKIICIVITDSTQHDTRLKAIVETYAPLCDGFLAASDQTDDSLGAVELFNKDQSAWERVTRTWSYVHQHYRNSFDAFHLAEDDTYLIPQNLRQLLSNYAGFYTQPLYLGGAVVPSRKTPEVRYCGGGAGYTLNRKALELVADGLGECSVIEKQQLPVDQQMAQCLNQLAHLQCGRTVDGESALRYLEFGIDYQANWSTKVQGSPIKAKPLKEYHKVYMRQGLGGIAADAVSIHLVNGNEPLTGFTPDYAIRRVHDILHGHCKSQWSQPALALEADGNSGYIHDPTFIRKNPLPFTTHPAGDRQGVCDPAFGSGIEGKDGYIGLQKIRIMPEEATNPKKLLCIVYTHSGRHDRVRSIAETYGPRCDGFMAASNLTDPSIGAVNLLHEGPEECKHCVAL